MSTQNIDPDNRDKTPNPKPFEASVDSRPVTQDEIAYRDGYVQGKSADQLEQDRLRAIDARRHEENARLRADNGISTGLIVGFVLAAVAAVFGGVLYLYNNDSQIPVTPTPEATSPEPTNETTIIERTIERTQEVVPAPSSAEPPQINVEVTPAPAPAPVPAPAPAPAPAPVPAPAPAPAPESQAQPEQPATQPSQSE